VTPNVTIISLIYRSPAYAIGLWKSLLASTPELKTGEANFYFVANNANSRTLSALKRHQIPFIEFNRAVLTDAQHFERGFAKPEYIGRVYAAYNFGIEKCTTQKVVLINSDMIFSPGWLTSLLKLENGQNIVSPTLVERNHPRFGVFPGAVEQNFGRSFRTFKSKKWETFLEFQTLSNKSVLEGGSYMPALFQTNWFKNFGFYPEGNLRFQDEEYEKVAKYGDEYLYETFKEKGIGHLTDPNSFCYHFKEGERSTTLESYLYNSFSFLRNQTSRIFQSWH
jgi:hypothetical protein